MKNILAMAAVALFMMTSCSSDDNANVTPPQDNTLLKKTIVTDEAGQIITTNIHTYNGNKLISIVGTDGYSANYTYTGNLITYAKFNDINEIGEAYVTEKNIEYNSINQKISETTLFKNVNYVSLQKEIFNYNQDGSVSVDVYNAFQSPPSTEDMELVFTQTETLTYPGNAVVNIGLSTQTFDDKNNPMKNTLGYNEFLAPRLPNEHNRLSASLENGELTITYTHIYNEDNYPESRTEVRTEGSSTITTHVQYFYE